MSAPAYRVGFKIVADDDGDCAVPVVAILFFYLKYSLEKLSATPFAPLGFCFPTMLQDVITAVVTIAKTNRISLLVAMSF